MNTNKLLFILIFGLVACNRLDRETKISLAEVGFSEPSIEKIQEAGYNSKDISTLIDLKKVGSTEDECLTLLNYLKQKNADTLVSDIQALLTLNTTSNLIIQLIENKSIPVYTDDIFAMKQEKLGDNLVLKISELMVANKTKTNGYNYAVLKTRGFSDNQILKFIEMNGTQTEVDYIRRDIALGITPEEALNRAFEKPTAKTISTPDSNKKVTK